MNPISRESPVASPETLDASPESLLAGRGSDLTIHDSGLRTHHPGVRTRTRVALAGFGTVGRSVARLLQDAVSEVELVAILNRDVDRKRVDWVDGAVRWTDSIDEVLDAPIDVLVELIGGRSPAEEWIRRALERGISVVTANKQVIAHDGASLLDTAAAQDAHLRFEAAVAGGVPVIRAIDSGLAGDRLTRVAGILNGTCNYILTKMERDGTAFADALREAQALGYAEANPSQDIDGLDAQAKLAILAMVALGVQAPPGAIPARSIRSVDVVDFRYARRLGCTIRQVAWAERSGELELNAGVGPSLVPIDSPLAAVNGSENLVSIHGRFGGVTTFGGRGAGGDPTAVAVLSDVLTIARGARPAVRTRAERSTRVSSDAATPYYVRFTVVDRPGIIAALASVFAKYDINIDAILQEPGYPASERPFIVSLDAAPSAVVNAALADIAAFDFHIRPMLAMPVFDEKAPAELSV
jgi:homoserine dehydrogenase